ncbi:hypothetical protein AC578_691 [Pseudocercospora eumusae]|uniref:Btz domain-containing protein n=1 Tax=Pseudocercospora eumusae TaxID=321146 RepID=A0A139HKQ8_9PEZI|nr:hypothetical protein AC578_691 [Pseudocercospora eumusae]
MAAGRSFIASRRRRADEEGEDEEGPVLVEDSQSEGSVLSELDDDEVDASSLGDPSAVEGAAVGAAEAGTNGASAVKKARKNRANKGKRRQDNQPAPVVVSSQAQSGAFNKAAGDTEAMMNGLSIRDQPDQEVVDFENMGPNGSSAPAPAIQPAPIERKIDSPAVHQRRDHEEYKKKRDADPAFIPNRGNFFMHDTRNHHGFGQPPMRGAWNHRGRGRGALNAAGPFAPAAHAAQAEKAAELPWKHDLHDTINEEPAPVNPSDTTSHQIESARLFPKAAPIVQQNQHVPPNKISFSSTTHAGKVLIRVYLPGMKSPVPFSEVPWKHYTRLPDHRPPLRRDKPVRVSLPGHVQRYIFPSSERSFIFIPRQMRPNQHGFGPNRYQRSIGGYGYSSRRTSMYGGSMYAASVAASRRSSFASVARENAFSPVGSFAGAMQQSRPVVRLPHGSQSHFSPAASTPLGPLSGHQTPTGMGMHSYPLPAQPQYQGTPTTTMHQPKPQKAISVTGIESPAMLQQAVPPHESQPFANQLPAHINDQPAFQPVGAYFSPRSSFSYPHPQGGTPLSGIPEQALQAPSFQPPMMPYAPGPYYAPYSQQQNYYYPSGPGVYPSLAMYAPPPPQNYMMSPPGQGMAPAQQQATPQQQAAQAASSEAQQETIQSQSGMVAHESNGMVFYMPASEAQQQSQGENYQPAESFVPSYAMPGLPPPTPAPEAPYFYAQQVPMASYYSGQGAQQQ